MFTTQINPITAMYEMINKAESAALQVLHFCPEDMQAHVVGFQKAYFTVARTNVEMLESITRQATKQFTI